MIRRCAACGELFRPGLPDMPSDGRCPICHELDRLARQSASERIRDEQEARRLRLRALWRGGAWVAALLAGVCAGLQFIGRDRGAPSDASETDAPPSPVASLEIQSDPGGAAVWVDGQPRGVTPLRVEWGNHAGDSAAVRIAKAGYRPVDRTIALSPGPNPELRIQLEPALQERVAEGAAAHGGGRSAADVFVATERQRVLIVVAPCADEPAAPVRERLKDLVDGLRETNFFQLMLPDDGVNGDASLALAGPATAERKVRAFDVIDAWRPSAAAGMPVIGRLDGFDRVVIVVHSADEAIALCERCVAAGCPPVHVVTTGPATVGKRMAEWLAANGGTCESWADVATEAAVAAHGVSADEESP